MPVIVEVPPEAVLTVADAKQYLRVEHGDDDGLIDGLIAAAQGQIDGPQGWLGRSLGRQTLRISGGVWPGAWRRLVLPFPPTISIVSITNAAGVVTDPASYTVDPSGTLAPVSGSAWSWSCWSGVTIRYVAGYPITPASGTVPAKWTGPAPIRAALLLMVADLYQHRDSTRAANVADNPTVARLLAPFHLRSL